RNVRTEATTKSKVFEFLVTYLTHINSVLNPILIFTLNKQFKVNFRKSLDFPLVVRQE
ncbi:hypothetical protein BgiMline_005418, partial [Biomphalaria glabrata]